MKTNIKHILTNEKVLESLKSLLITLQNFIVEEKIRYVTRILLIQFLSELCKKFFYFPEILYHMKINLKEEGNKKFNYDQKDSLFALP